MNVSREMAGSKTSGKSRKVFPFLLWLIFVLASYGCNSDPAEPVVYADPLMRNYVNEQLAEWQDSRPEFPAPKVKWLSSEFIFQHLKYGQPIDVVFVVNAGYVKSAESDQLFSRFEIAGGDSLVVVRSLKETKQKAFNSENCIALPPADSPLDRLGRFWLDTWSQFPWDCEVFPQDADLLMHYAREGWTRWSLVSGSVARSMPDKVEQMRSGPYFRDLYRMGVPHTAKNDEWALNFMEFCLRQKTEIPFVQIQSIP